MATNKRTREQMLAHCGEIHDDDGVDPRIYFKSTTQRDKNNRKAKQLCSQVAHTLALVLQGEFGDELLHGLHVVAVEPAPDVSRLLVTICADIPECNEDTDDKGLCAQEILNRLTAVSGHLRAEVTAGITRKRAPKLVFRLSVPCETDTSGDQGELP